MAEVFGRDARGAALCAGVQRIRNESDRLCKEHGLSVVTPGQERFTRSKTPGEAYTVEAITERIAGTYRAKPKALRQEKAGISMLIDIQNSIKAAESNFDINKVSSV